ncbi:hypothetical protein [Spirosoma pollinicola]|uniref:Uncharacterized protein n=1 Tax=Spirosoma pollinicola TaxID=2057025 RepID=A0A2K8YZE0_9BACT|nr:hypothetical protein [Spirosoma pollinicola]AUD02969.1 hypothetical protein CWM47_14675 [Spirosoma pollinicola]
MQEAKSSHQDLDDSTVTPLRGLSIMVASVFAIMIAIATPILGEALFALLFYGKSGRKTAKTNI